MRGDRRHRPTATACYEPAAAGPRRRAATCPAASPGPSSWPRCASRSRTDMGDRGARSSRWPPSDAGEHRQLRGGPPRREQRRRGGGAGRRRGRPSGTAGPAPVEYGFRPGDGPARRDLRLRAPGHAGRFWPAARLATSVARNRERVQCRGGPVVGQVTVPGSKSIANRALGGRRARRRRVSTAARACPTATTPRALVAGLEAGSGSAVVAGSGDRALVAGRVARPAPLRPAVPASTPAWPGTTSRFLTALAARGRRRRWWSTATAPLRSRPDGGSCTTSAGGARRPNRDLRPAPSGQLPVRGERAAARRWGGAASAGDVSSQFITALMLVGPVLEGGLRIELTTPLVSRPATSPSPPSVMGAFGAEVEV